MPSRREFLRGAATLIASTPLLPLPSKARGIWSTQESRLFTMDLTPGAIGVVEPLPKVVELASKFGFESIAPDAGYLVGLDDDRLAAFRMDLESAGLTWGAASLTVDFRGDEETFVDGMRELESFAGTLERAGVERVGTWLRPSHDTLTYLGNFRQHARRLREIATILGDHGLRFGLEYVGPKTSWTSARHPFVHTLAETRELIDAIDRDNVGIVLDSWHWYTAGEEESDLLTLTNRDIVACDLNDAPAGISVDQQMDLTRDLPLATGVIDLKTFLDSLVRIGYDGPVRAEPFKQELRRLTPEQAVATTSQAMKAAFALVDQPSL